MYWFNKNFDKRTSSVFFFSFFFSHLLAPLSAIPSSCILNSGWHGRAVQSRLQLFAPPPPLLIRSSANEPCSLVLRSAVYLTNSFCGLWFFFFISLVNLGNGWAVCQIQIPYIRKERVENFCIESGLHPLDLFVHFTSNYFERNIG